VGKVFKPDLRRLAIRRIYDEALEKAGLSARVVEVVEDKKRGLVARVSHSGNPAQDKVQDAIGGFITPWEFAD